MEIVIGAGYSGLIYGAMNAQAQIYERNSSSVISHRAVLRFRDDRISKSLGIPFKRVTVHKAIWGASTPTPRLANQYSLKTRGIIRDASIWDIEPVTRYIAPLDFHQQLVDRCGDRVHWDITMTINNVMQWESQNIPIISTVPLPVLLKLLGMESYLTFRRRPIIVDRFVVADCDVHQTIYFPDPSTPIYRASITGNVLMVESMREVSVVSLDVVRQAFGFENNQIQPAEHSSHGQEYGKIIPIGDLPRKALLHRITREYGIYSLGRFAVWKNILLDDVHNDISVIRRMMTLSEYDNHLERNEDG